eukprot:9428468-Alexandrium_andersonii.AAC.1
MSGGLGGGHTRGNWLRAGRHATTRQGPAPPVRALARRHVSLRLDCAALAQAQPLQKLPSTLP